ncbi:MAG TPA: YciI family protein [Terracidiphilus sp.]|nr:YciI family protein [Terracidiphilus sp.]
MKPFSLLVAALLLGSGPVLFGQSQPGTAPATVPAGSPPAGLPAPPLKSWLIKIIPPRPTFDKDGTPAENALMSQHFVYWKDLNAKGVCIFGGPVLDPKGVYGIIVVRAATLDEAKALAAGDPSVKAGLIKNDIAEMAVAFVPPQKP